MNYPRCGHPHREVRQVKPRARDNYRLRRCLLCKRSFPTIESIPKRFYAKLRRERPDGEHDKQLSHLFNCRH